MTYKTILTTKGTTTIPIEIRRQLGIKPGMYVSFVKNQATDEYTLKRSQTIEEIRDMNKRMLEQAGTSKIGYKSGDGFNTYVREKYDTKV